MLHIWCQMDTALSPQLLPLRSNTEQVVTPSSGCRRVAYSSIWGGFFKGNLPWTFVLSCVTLLCFCLFTLCWVGLTVSKCYGILLRYRSLLSCEVITSIWMLQWTPKYFSMFKMELFHLIISAIFSPVCVLLSPQNWTNLEPALISWLGFVVIADMCGARWLIDSSDSAARIQTVPFPLVMSQRRRQVQRPRSASLRPAITQRTHTTALQCGPVSSFSFC